MTTKDLGDVVTALEDIKAIQESAHGYGFSDGPIVELLNKISSQLDDTNSKLDVISRALVRIAEYTDEIARNTM